MTILTSPSNTYVFSDLIANAGVDSGSNLIGQNLQAIANRISDHDNKLNDNNEKLKQIATSQNVMYTMTTNEAERLNRKKQNVDQALDGQNRMILLNDSYVKKYAKYNQIILVIVLVILAILGAIMLGTYVPAVPSVINDLIMILAVGIGLIVIYNIYMEIQKRDSLYFDKLKTSIPDLSGNSKSKDDVDINSDQWDMLNAGCVGKTCCGPSPMHYIDGKCRTPPPNIWDFATETAKDGWSWDTDNNQWTRLKRDGSKYPDNTTKIEYWNFKLTTPAVTDLPYLPPAPVTSDTFSNMNSKSIDTIDNYETGYTSYR